MIEEVVPGFIAERPTVAPAFRTRFPALELLIIRLRPVAFAILELLETDELSSRQIEIASLSLAARFRFDIDDGAMSVFAFGKNILEGDRFVCAIFPAI